MNLAPIVLFVYNRPSHTRKVLEALSSNKWADQSVLYIYADGPKQDLNQELIDKISEVREVISSKKWCKEVHIKTSDKNKGLANSIISGVTELLNIHQSVIVLEDDLVTATGFLDYMNNALTKYENEKSVKQISGYCFPIHEEGNNGSMFFPLSTTWGWATWLDRWGEIDFECADYNKLKTNKALSHQFNLDGAYNYTKMFVAQMESNGKISSWGVRYWWNVFKSNGLVLYPDMSLVKNIGWDGSGRHGDAHELFPLVNWDDNYLIKSYPTSPATHEERFAKLKDLLRYEMSFSIKATRKIKQLISKILSD